MASQPLDAVLRVANLNGQPTECLPSDLGPGPTAYGAEPAAGRAKQHFRKVPTRRPNAEMRSTAKALANKLAVPATQGVSSTLL